MVLISLLIVLAMERLVAKNEGWRGQYYARRYREWLTSRGWLTERTDAVSVYGQLLLPALLVALITDWVLGGFLGFVAETVILFICIGCPVLRDIYRKFLDAASRGDLEACSLYTEQLGHCRELLPPTGEAPAEQGKSFGQHLLWLNYQHYAAVLLSFVLFGAAGAVFYVLLREHFSYFCSEGDEDKAKMLKKLLHIVDFVPTRITAFGLLLVGDFSKALPVWLRYLPDVVVPAEVVLTEVAGQAEYVREATPREDWDASTEPKALVTLAKRNIVLLMSVTAILTLMGLLS